MHLLATMFSNGSISICAEVCVYGNDLMATIHPAVLAVHHWSKWVAESGCLRGREKKLLKGLTVAACDGAHAGRNSTLCWESSELN